MHRAIVDTGVWLAIFDEKEEHYKEGQEKVEILNRLQVLIPWPTMYETLRTKFVNKTIALKQFEKFLKSSEVIYLDDLPYRDVAFQLSFVCTLIKKRPLSMVDCLLRLMIDDVSVKVRYHATFNRRDFIDLCNKRGIEII
jgi:predicted nucleic acid-binding protein